jgi:methanogenic corrinoid protein MtbC1
MKRTTDAVRAAGLKTRVMVAGGLACLDLMNYANADAFSRDMVEGVRVCQRLVKN